MFKRPLSAPPKIFLVLILLASLSLLLWSAWTDTATFDEAAHIPAGYSYVKYLDYRLNPEHPPLVKAVSAIPLLFLNLNFPDKNSGWTTEINGQWTTGADFLYNSGNDAQKIIRLARIGPIFLTLILTFFVYFWSSKLLGKWWAFLPTILTAFSPNFLAHGHYVTTDIGAALGVLASTYFFIRLLKKRRVRDYFYAGITLGLAELAKFSAVLLIPFLFLLLIGFYFACVHQKFVKNILHYLGMYIAVIFIAYALVVYPVYAVFVSRFPQAKQIETVGNILGSYGGGPTPPGEICKLSRCPADLALKLSEYSIARPAGQYLFGVLMILQRAAGGNNNYFWGVNSSHGSRLYFPAVYAFKEPLAVLLLTALALVLGIQLAWRGLRDKERFHRFRDFLGINFELFAIFGFVILYWLYSVKSPLNIGYRHLMPVVPLTYILVGKAIKEWRSIFIKSVAVPAVVLLLILETAFVAPHFLSFFNILGGGSANGYRYATDSNYDWGQDLLRLAEWADKNLPAGRQVAVDYFGGGKPSYYLGDKEIDWWSGKGNPKNDGIEWLAISANTLQGAVQPITPELLRKPEDEYRWLQNLRPAPAGLGQVSPPDYRAGHSIFIYKL